jgi:competence protein ComEC
MILKYPVIPITFFTASGILAGSYWQPPFVVLCLLALAAAALLLGAWRQAGKLLLQKPWFALAGWFCAAILGMGVQQLHYGPNYSLHYSHKLNTESPIIKGTITERLKPNDFSEKYYLEVTTVNKQPATGTLLLTVPKDSLAKTLHAGDVLFIGAMPQPITAARNPYQFDYAAYMAKQDVHHQIKLRQNYVVAGKQIDFNYHIQQLRDKLIGSFVIHNFKPQTLQVINALLFGQRQDMDKQTNDSYTSAGVVHILAISGLHFSLLFLAFSRILSPLKRMPKVGRLGHLFAIMALMWGFAFITGLSASVVRAVVMFTIILTADALNRRANIYNSLAVSMLVLLLARPAFLFDAGFQLSYLAVFAIVWLQPLYARFGQSKFKAVQFIKDTVAISFIAQVGVLPLSLYYFNQFPLLFLVANVVVIPLSNLVLGLGIVTLLLNFTFPAGAIWLGIALEFSVKVMNGFISWIAAFKSLVLTNIPFTLLLQVLLYIVIVTAVLWLYRQSFKRAAAVLCSVIVFQLAYMCTVYSANTHSELVVFHNYKATLLAQKSPQGIVAMSNDSLAGENRIISDYTKGSFNPKLTVKPLSPLLWHNGKKVLVLDSLAIYSPTLRPDVLLLTQNTKVNLNRVLAQLQPKLVVADGTSYNNVVKRWAAACQKQKIPFHATAEKGYYVLE